MCRVHICMKTAVRARVFVYTYIHTVCVCACMSMHIYICVCVHVNIIYICVRARMYVHIYIYTHNIHMYAYCLFNNMDIMWHHWQGSHDDEYVKYSLDDLAIVIPHCAYESKSTTKEQLQNTQNIESDGHFEVGKSTSPLASEYKAFLVEQGHRQTQFISRCK